MSEVKLSTLGSILEQPEQIIETQEEQVEQPQEQVVEQAAEVEQVVEQPQDEAPLFEIADDVPVVEQPKDWREAIKGVDKNELLKELGVEFDEFDIEFAKYRKSGGDPYKYLEAKTFDYNKVSDLDLMKSEFAKKYAHLTPEEQSYLFNKKYGVTDLDDEDVKIDKNIALKADAHEVRQARIAEQQKFKIPEATVQPQQPVDDKTEQVKQYVVQHEATKNLLTSKRVEVGGGFKFQINKPESLTDIVLNGNSKYTTNEKGEPDLGKLYKIALYTAMGEKYDEYLINYGKSLAQKAIIEEGQNAQRPIGRPVTQPEKQTAVIGFGKIGQRR